MAGVGRGILKKVAVLRRILRTAVKVEGDKSKDSGTGENIKQLIRERGKG